MTFLGFTFEVEEQTSTIPTVAVEISVNHLVVDRSDATGVSSLVATIDLVNGSSQPVYDDIGAIISGYPLSESSSDVNKVITFPLRATVDSTGAGRHLRSLLDDNPCHYTLTLTGTVDGRQKTLINRVQFDVDAEDPSPSLFTDLVGVWASFSPTLNAAAKAGVAEYIAQTHAIHVRGSVTSSAALAGKTGKVLADAWVTEDDGHVWLYTASVSPGTIAGFIDTGPLATDLLPLPLYTLTGYTTTLPGGETPVADYADIAAFEAAVVADATGERCQIAGYPTLADFSVLEARWTGTIHEWGIA